MQVNSCQNKNQHLSSFCSRLKSSSAAGLFPFVAFSENGFVKWFYSKLQRLQLCYSRSETASVVEQSSDGKCSQRKELQVNVNFLVELLKVFPVVSYSERHTVRNIQSGLFIQSLFTDDVCDLWLENSKNPYMFLCIFECITTSLLLILFFWLD